MQLTHDRNDGCCMLCTGLASDPLARNFLDDDHQKRYTDYYTKLVTIGWFEAEMHVRQRIRTQIQLDSLTRLGGTSCHCLAVTDMDVDGVDAEHLPVLFHSIFRDSLKAYAGEFVSNEDYKPIGFKFGGQLYKYPSLGKRLDREETLEFLNRPLIDHEFNQRVIAMPTEGDRIPLVVIEPDCWDRAMDAGMIETTLYDPQWVSREFERMERELAEVQSGSDEIDDIPF